MKKNEKYMHYYLWFYVVKFSSFLDPGRQDSAVSNDGEGIRIIIDDVDSSRNREGL